MVLIDFFIKRKARRRIRRFIKTGQHQPRTYTTATPNVYEYKVKHHVKSLYFKKGRFGRLKQISNPSRLVLR